MITWRWRLKIEIMFVEEEEGNQGVVSQLFGVGYMHVLRSGFGFTWPPNSQNICVKRKLSQGGLWTEGLEYPNYKKRTKKEADKTLNILSS